MEACERLFEPLRGLVDEAEIGEFRNVDAGFDEAEILQSPS
jgi:hypothetical protein